MSVTDEIRSAIREAQRYEEELPSPPNEANTCDWVIRPLLRAMGYENHEILAQANDAAGKFPDYTVLPKGPYTWYLEAKPWSSGLDSHHVDQALNYAHQNGQQWVVLSNGREWRLFDDRIQGKASDRLVAVARLCDADGLAKFLGALSKGSATSGGVSDFALAARVATYIEPALQDPSSDIVQAIARVVRRALPGANVSGQLVAEVLGRHVHADRPPAADSPRSAQKQDRASTDLGISGELHMRARDLVASGHWTGEHFILHRGSQLSKTRQKGCQEAMALKASDMIHKGLLADRGDYLVALQDIEYRSPSGASDLVYGGTTNGWKCWTNEQGVRLDAICPRTEKPAKLNVIVPRCTSLHEPDRN